MIALEDRWLRARAGYRLAVETTDPGAVEWAERWALNVPGRYLVEAPTGQRWRLTLPGDYVGGVADQPAFRSVAVEVEPVAVATARGWNAAPQRSSFTSPVYRLAGLPDQAVALADGSLVTASAGRLQRLRADGVVLSTPTGGGWTAALVASGDGHTLWRCDRAGGWERYRLPDLRRVDLGVLPTTERLELPRILGAAAGGDSLLVIGERQCWRLAADGTCQGPCPTAGTVLTPAGWAVQGGTLLLATRPAGGASWLQVLDAVTLRERERRPLPAAAVAPLRLLAAPAGLALVTAERLLLSTAGGLRELPLPAATGLTLAAGQWLQSCPAGPVGGLQVTELAGQPCWQVSGARWAVASLDGRAVWLGDAQLPGVRRIALEPQATRPVATATAHRERRP
ncbi:MAG: hypothetical protein IT204_08775 [Fimbriimonadaceae bacterium]|nr:hypothetical protein [Fimbriimonadaceae bacterium]